jgi:hypothetical protein
MAIIGTEAGSAFGLSGRIGEDGLDRQSEQIGDLEG